MSIEAMKQALEVLERASDAGYSIECEEALTSIRQAIAEAEKQEPHSWYSAQEDEWMTNKIRKEHERLNSYTHKVGKFDLALYTHPQPKREWVGLTDEEVFETHKQVDSMQYLTFGKAIEAKLREKNGWYRQHVTDGSPCWCEPEISYTDPETGASVIVHKEPQ